MHYKTNNNKMQNVECIRCSSSIPYHGQIHIKPRNHFRSIHSPFCPFSSLKTSTWSCLVCFLSHFVKQKENLSVASTYYTPFLLSPWIHQGALALPTYTTGTQVTENIFRLSSNFHIYFKTSSSLHLLVCMQNSTSARSVLGRKTIKRLTCNLMSFPVKLFSFFFLSLIQNQSLPLCVVASDIRQVMCITCFPLFLLRFGLLCVATHACLNIVVTTTLKNCIQRRQKYARGLLTWYASLRLLIPLYHLMIYIFSFRLPLFLSSFCSSVLWIKLKVTFVSLFFQPLLLANNM